MKLSNEAFAIVQRMKDGERLFAIEVLNYELRYGNIKSAVSDTPVQELIQKDALESGQEPDELKLKHPHAIYSVKTSQKTSRRASSKRS
jgi:hypothetical protein